MHHLNTTWIISPSRRGIGAACVILGAVLLIAPHHLLNPGQVLSTLHHDFPGFSLVLAGVLLLLVDTFQPGRRVTVWVHAIALVVLTQLIWMFAQTQAWTGVLMFTPVALIVGAAPFLERHHPADAPGQPDAPGKPAEQPSEHIRGGSVDLMAIALASITFVVGLVIAGLSTEVIRVSNYPVQAVRLLTGFGFMITSVLVIMNPNPVSSRTAWTG